MRNLGSLHELERELLVVELDREDGSWRGPGPNHQMVEGHFGVTSAARDGRLVWGKLRANGDDRDETAA